MVPLAIAASIRTRPLLVQWEGGTGASSLPGSGFYALNAINGQKHPRIEEEENGSLVRLWVK